MRVDIFCHPFIAKWLVFSDFHAFKSISAFVHFQLKIWQVQVGSSPHRVIPVTTHYSRRCNFIILRHEQSLTSPSRHHNVHKDGVQISFLSKGVWVRLVVMLCDVERLLRELLIEATLSWSHRPCGGFVLHYQHRLNQHFNTLGFIKPKSWPGNVTLHTC